MVGNRGNGRCRWVVVGKGGKWLEVVGGIVGIGGDVVGMAGMVCNGGNGGNW